MVTNQWRKLVRNPKKKQPPCPPVRDYFLGKCQVSRRHAGLRLSTKAKGSRQFSSGGFILQPELLWEGPWAPWGPSGQPPEALPVTPWGPSGQPPVALLDSTWGPSGQPPGAILDSTWGPSGQPPGALLGSFLGPFWAAPGALLGSSLGPSE